MGFLWWKTKGKKMQLDLTQYPVDGSIVVNGVVYVPKQQEN